MRPFVLHWIRERPLRSRRSRLTSERVPFPATSETTRVPSYPSPSRNRCRHLSSVALVSAVIASVLVMVGGVASAETYCGGQKATHVVPEEWPDDVVFPGTDGDDVIAGTSGDDFIDAGLGNDMICGFGGNDILIGGGKAFVNGQWYGIGIADYGAHGGADWIWGNSGDDIIFGGPGPDNLSGNKGRDQIFGGNGPDKIYGGPGHDYPPNLDPSVNLQQFESVMAGGAVGLDGGKGNDQIFGGTGKDIIFGGAGRDYMDGGGQNDRIFGSTDGGETLIGGQGEDIVKARGTKEGDPPDQVDGGIGVDLIIGSWGTQSCIDGPVFATCEQPETSVILDGAPADLIAAVDAFAGWIANPGTNPQPQMPAGLAAWLGGINRSFLRVPLEFRGQWAVGIVGGQRAAMVYEPFYPRRSDYKPNEDPPGIDVLIYVDTGAAWELSAARLDRYGIGSWGDSDPFQVCNWAGTISECQGYDPAGTSADLSLTKSVDEANPGYLDAVVFTIVVSNGGPGQATGVSVSDQLPDGLNYISDDGGGTYDAATGVWTVGALAPGASASLQITTRVSGEGQIENTASVAASDQADPDSTPGDAAVEDDLDSATMTAPAQTVTAETEEIVTQNGAGTVATGTRYRAIRTNAGDGSVGHFLQMVIRVWAVGGGPGSDPFEYVLTIPKEFAAHINDLVFSVPPDQVIDPDPVIVWDIELDEQDPTPIERTVSNPLDGVQTCDQAPVTEGGSFDGDFGAPTTHAEGAAFAAAFNVNADGTFSYTHDGGEDFPVKITGFDGATEVGCYDILGIPVNDPPAAVDDPAAGSEGDTTLFEGGGLDYLVPDGVLANDTDVEGGRLTAVVVDEPDHDAAFTLNANGTFSYTHDGSETTTDSFTYTANDGTDDSDPATVTLTITPVNDPPTVVDDSHAVTEGGTLNVNGVLDNDIDPDGPNPLQVVDAQAQSGPSHGTLNLAADGSFTYTHDGSETTTDSFTYKATDGAAESNEATVTITINPVNDDPVAVDDGYSVDEGGILNVNGVLDNDIDPDGPNPLQVVDAQAQSGPSHGTLNLAADGSFTYTHDGSETTTDSFTYKATDGAAESNEATVTITINPVNDDPVAVDDGYAVAKGGAIDDAAPGVLENDADAEDDALSVWSYTNPVHGNATVYGSGRVTYTHDGSDTTADSFTYRIWDGTALSDPATVTITICDPCAADDAYTVHREDTLFVPADGVLDNDSDPGSDPITVAGPAPVTPPAHGALTLNADGSFMYVHDGSAASADSFTYRATDGSGNSNLATVTLTIEPADVMWLGTDTFGTTQYPFTLPSSYTAVFVAHYGCDNDGFGGCVPREWDTWRFGSWQGRLDINGTRISEWRYFTDDSYYWDIEWDAVTKGSDGHWSWIEITPYVNPGANNALYYHNTGGPGDGIKIKVIPAVNVAPLANDDGYSVEQGETLVVNGVLDNDTDANGDALQVVDNDAGTAGVQPVGNVDHGDLTLNLDGTFTYVHDGGTATEDTFTYRATDGSLESNVATVTITINPPNDPPTAVNDGPLATVMEWPISRNAASGILSNDTDPDGNDLTVVDTDAGTAGVQPETSPAHGTLDLSADGSFTYTPEGDFIGSDTFTYRASDGFEDSNTATVTFDVGPKNWLEIWFDRANAAWESHGISVATDGATVVGGADFTGSGNHGRIQIYTPGAGGAWNEAIVNAPVPVGTPTWMKFGRSVAVSGNRIVVGAPGQDWSEGAAYVYTNSGGTWSKTATLQASDGTANDQFGAAVAIDGDRIIVGAPKDAPGGAVYVYDWNGSAWVETKLTASDAESDDRFGAAVATAGDFVVVGAAGEDASGDGAGAAYAYRWSGSAWNEAKLTAGDANDSFGTAVAVSGDRLVVGATGYGGNHGAAYVYDWGGAAWSQATMLQPATPSTSDDFGCAVGVVGRWVVVGASMDDGEATNGGAAFIFHHSTNDTWYETRLDDNDADADDFMGWSVAAGGDLIVIGKPGDDTTNWSGDGSGAVGSISIYK